MTRDEIDELIKYLEENYHVKCSYKNPKREDGLGEFTLKPILPIRFTIPQKNADREIIKRVLVEELDKRDLIRS